MTITNNDGTRRYELALASQKLGRFQSNPRAVSNEPSGRAKSIVTSLYQTMEGLTRQLPGEARYEDANLSPEGLQEARAERVQLMRDAVAARIEILQPHLDTAVKDATAAAEQYKPQLDLNDVAQLTRTAQAWENAIKPQLAAGKDWDQIIPTLDHDGLLAAERFAPGHEAAKRDRFSQHEVPSVLEGIARMSAHRVVEAAPEGPARDALVQEAKVIRYADAAKRSVQALTAVTGTSDLIPASIAVKSATFQVGAQPVAEPTE